VTRFFASSWQIVVDLTSALAWPAAAVALGVLAIRFLRNPDPTGTTESELHARVSGWAFRRKLTYHVGPPARVIEATRPRQLGRPVTSEVVEVGDTGREPHLQER
jgi:hypothetical protein